MTLRENWWWVLTALTMVACSHPSPRKAPVVEGVVEDVVEAPVEPPPIFDEGPPRLPSPAGIGAPSRATWEGDTTLLSDTVTCASCHEDVAASWALSAHARSSFDNPWYRASIEAFRRERGNEASRFCAGCHDPILLVSGAIDEEVAPDDLRAHAGIPCLVCHSTQETTSDGNGSYALDLSPVPIPDPDDEAQVAAHVARVTPAPLRTAALCGSCHRSFIGAEVGSPHHLAGIDDIGAWRQSAYAGADGERLDDVEEATCASCHMQPIAAQSDLAATDGEVSSHQVGASHTALPGGTHLLVGAASVDVAATRVDGEWFYPSEEASPGRSYTFDVVVRNETAGHRFPGGTRDLQDTWLEVGVYDADGELIAEAGKEHEAAPDPSAYRFRSVIMDAEGRPEEDHLVHRFTAAAYDRTIAARDAVLIRYNLRTSRSAVPARVRVRLRHRKHAAGLRAMACEASRSERGQAFDAMAVRLNRVPLDGCAPKPITLIAEVERCLGCEAEGDLYSRFRNLAIARSHSLQERLDEVRPAIGAARRLAEDDERQSELDVLLAGVAGRQGRVDEALTLVRDHTSVAAARARGRAYAQVWRWAEAAEAYEEVAQRSPFDPGALRDLAQALGSTDSPLAAAAARAGLRFGPRVESLLRTQSLATDDEAAREAYLTHRAPDEVPALRRQCEELSEECARDRQPVPTIALRRR